MTLDDLRMCLNLANNTRNADRWDADQWLRLYKAYRACDWDITPDCWTWWQVAGALDAPIALTPVWGEHEHDPIPPIARAGFCPICVGEIVDDGDAGHMCANCGAPVSL